MNIETGDWILYISHEMLLLISYCCSGGYGPLAVVFNTIKRKPSGNGLFFVLIGGPSGQIHGASVYVLYLR